MFTTTTTTATTARTTTITNTITTTISVVEQTYELYMTGSNPQHTRVYLLYAENKDRMILSIYYHSPQRLDVYGDNVMIYPKNTEISNDGDYSLKVSQLF